MERYTRLYTLPENLYTQGSPVTIAAGALLLDNQTGSVMAQLKFRNVSQHDIKAVFVSVEAFDVAHTQLSGVESYQYLDLQEKRDAEFGQKQAIRLPDATARSFAPRCTRVVLDDDTLWEAPENAAWESLPKPTPISEKVSGELLEQYKRDTAEYAVYAPESFSGLWRCTCGELNEETEETCHICRLSRQTQTDALNEEALQEHLTAYEAAEAEKAAKLRAEQEALEAQKAAERAARKKKARKIFAIIGAAALLCVAVALLITKVIIPNNKYNAAAALMNDGQYEEAILAFRAMDGYKDSTEQITECQYLDAVRKMNNGEYENAIAEFKLIGSYKDSTDLITQCETGIKENAYIAAVTLMNEGKYEEAIDAFKKISNYKDSKDLIKQCKTGIQDNAYEEAVSLLNSGKTVEAYESLIAMDGYKDSAEKAESIYAAYVSKKYSILLKAGVGDTVRFGTYEQDNKTSNGQEKIEWLVLAKKDGKILVVSKYVLDFKQYNSDWVTSTWESCTLRKWMNGTFLKNAFTEV